MAPNRAWLSGLKDTDRDTILEMSDVSVTFDMSRGRSTVLNDVDLRVQRGEVLGIIGESGSGKSMCASALLNAVVPPGELTGSVTYYPADGTPVDLLAISKEELQRIRWRDIAFLVQNVQSAFNPTMTIREHFVETLRSHGEGIESGIDRMHELFSDLHLNADQVLYSYPHELSGGMKQRALIALCLVLDPEVLVMDEPISSLDLLMQRSILSLLSKLKEKYDLTLVFITHDLLIVSDIADRLAVMYAFEIVERGKADTVVKDASHPYTRALFRSVPDVVAPLEGMQPIDGSSPDPVNIPNGCSYHPRCPLATVECVREEPGYHEVTANHDVKCFYWDQAKDAIPMGFYWKAPSSDSTNNEGD